MDGKVKVRKEEAKRKQEGKIGMLRRRDVPVRCVTAVRERVEDSALASPSLALRHSYWSHIMLHTINLPLWTKDDE